MKNKAIFLDRDWTINYDYSYVYKLEDLKILDWAKEWLENLKALWYLLILVTNQSWIWRCRSWSYCSIFKMMRNSIWKCSISSLTL